MLRAWYEKNQKIYVAGHRGLVGSAIVRRIVGYPGDIAFDAGKPDGMSRKLLDVSRFTELGWKPRFFSIWTPLCLKKPT